jgi:hypothetical protein
VGEAPEKGPPSHALDRRRPVNRGDLEAVTPCHQWHICPFHGAEPCRYTNGHPTCWNDGYEPLYGPLLGISHFCWTLNGDSPGWFTGLLYYSKEQALEALPLYPLPVKVCECCGQVTKDARENGFDGADATHDGVPVLMRRAHA